VLAAVIADDSVSSIPNPSKIISAFAILPVILSFPYGSNKNLVLYSSHFQAIKYPL
jgi:hypothetical protein